MGRGGRGGGGGGRSGGSRGGGGGRSGGFRGSGGGGSHSSGSRGGFHGGHTHGVGGPPPGGGFHGGYHRPHHHVYYGGYGHGYRTGSGCSTTFSMVFIILLIFVIFALQSCSAIFGVESEINAQVVAEECIEYYEENFGDRSDVFLMYIAYSDNLDMEYDYVWYGADVVRYCDDNLNTFFDLYEDNIRDDVGQQLALTLDSYNSILSSMNVDKVKGKSFNDNCYEDNLGWLDSKSLLSEAAKDLHDETGIQFYVVTAQYDKMSGAKTDNTGVWVTFVIVAAAIIIGYVIFKYSKKKKEQKNKELEQQIKILNTPLDEFGDLNSIDNLAKKYDEQSSSDDKI